LGSDIENYITTNDTSGFFDKLPISSGIELELDPLRRVPNSSSNPELIGNLKKKLNCSCPFYLFIYILTKEIRDLDLTRS
jgi:hypothetical protein